MVNQSMYNYKNYGSGANARHSLVARLWPGPQQTLINKTGVVIGLVALPRQRSTVELCDGSRDHARVPNQAQSFLRAQAGGLFVTRLYADSCAGRFLCNQRPDG